MKYYFLRIRLISTIKFKEIYVGKNIGQHIMNPGEGAKGEEHLLKRAPSGAVLKFKKEKEKKNRA